MAAKISLENWVTPAEAGKLVGVSRSNIYYHAKQGHLWWLPIGGRIMVNKSSLGNFDWRQKQPNGKISRWTPAKKRFLLENYEFMSNSLLARKLGFCTAMISSQMHNMNLKRLSRRRWSKKKERYLRDSVDILSTSQIAEQTGMSEKYIENKIVELEL